METIKKVYVLIAVVCFTVAFPIGGKTPLQWGMTGFQLVMSTVNGAVN